MAGWNDLVYAGLRVVPFDGPLPPPPPGGRRHAPFRATFSRTTTLLRRELAMLDAKQLVVELAIRDQDIRLDGFPRANARPAESPAVRVTFESKWGPVRMETGEFREWTDNLRAIALSLEALRLVDRYGVSKRGEQYRGWKQLPMGAVDPADLIVTPEQARRTLSIAAGLDEDGWGQMPGPDIIIRAVKRTHPDVVGGDVTEFRKVQKAREVLEQL